MLPYFQQGQQIHNVGFIRKWRTNILLLFHIMAQECDCEKYWAKINNKTWALNPERPNKSLIKAIKSVLPVCESRVRREEQTSYRRSHKSTWVVFTFLFLFFFSFSPSAFLMLSGRNTKWLLEMFPQTGAVTFTDAEGIIVQTTRAGSQTAF